MLCLTARPWTRLPRLRLWAKASFTGYTLGSRLLFFSARVTQYIISRVCSAPRVWGSGLTTLLNRDPQKEGSGNLKPPLTGTVAAEVSGWGLRILRFRASSW